MKLIKLTEDARYNEQADILVHLYKSLAETQAIVESTASKLFLLDSTTGKNLIGDVLAMIDGNTAAPRQGLDAVATEHAEAKRKEQLINEAITEQQAVLSALVSSISEEVNKRMEGERVEALRAIASSLHSLETALENERALRSSIENAGYRCTMRGFAVFQLGSSPYSDGALKRHLTEVSNYVTDYDDETSGKLNKPVNVRLLCDIQGQGKVLDVVQMDGKLARSYQRIGHVEVTTEKPRRAEVKANQETVW
jgi:hypothetical protein